MPRIVLVLVVVGVLSSACQPLQISESTIVTNGTAVDRIVVSTITGAIVVYDANGDEVLHTDPPEGHTYHQPTWLDDSTIVFADASDVGDHALFAVDADGSGVVWRAKMETVPFYFSPAPAGSAFGTTSLRNDPSGSGLIAELIDETGNVTELSNESPLYTSWSPLGKALAIHIAGQHLDVQREDETETILSETGLFQTPVWVEEGLVTLRTVSGIQRLSLWNDGSFTDLAEVDGQAAFVAVGDQVAIQATERPDAGSLAASLRAQDLPAVSGGRLVVIDLGTGTMHTASSEPAHVFQWDQQGEALLYATGGSNPVSLVWHVWSDGQDEVIESFTVQPQWFETLVPFFDQYAQSVHFWSSSGDYIGYPTVIGTDPFVILVPLAGGESVMIPDATWSSWEPQG
jgi:hypothetical protein